MLEKRLREEYAWALCDEAGDCRRWRVTSAEYVRQSGGWELSNTRVSTEGYYLHMGRQAPRETNGC